MLDSAIHQHVAAIGIHMSPSSCTSLQSSTHPKVNLKPSLPTKNLLKIYIFLPLEKLLPEIQYEFKYPRLHLALELLNLNLQNFQEMKVF